MDLLIPDAWLREYLDTKATKKQITDLLSLSGPTVDKVTGSGSTAVYSMEVTTNRVDSASIYGIAREAAAILPRFGIPARLKPIRTSPVKNTKKLDFHIKNDPKLCSRIYALKLEDVQIGPSPKWLQDRLKMVGQRPLNNAIDITNYVMWEVGHPIHVFDYDRLKEKTIVIREADKGEKITTLDDKEHTLLGGEVVFDDGTGEIVDLPGIMGTKNSIVTKDTKNVLLWIESIDPVRIRKASMSHALRSWAAVLNEKSVDPELGQTSILRAKDLFLELTKGVAASKLVVINEKPYKKRSLTVKKEFMDNLLGVSLTKSQISSYLRPLEFSPSWKNDTLSVGIPSIRDKDIAIAEDIVEEIARIYGYHNLPSILMTGLLPEQPADSPFAFETKVKQILKGLGGYEVYTYSLVSKKLTDKNSLELNNPLGEDGRFLRSSLRGSLVQAANKNSGEKKPFHLFEMSNVYIPKRSKLPEETLTLSGVFVNYSYREAKGVIESLLTELSIQVNFVQKDIANFKPSKAVEIVDNKSLGVFGELESESYLHYEIDVENLRNSGKTAKSYKNIPTNPPQIEDVTLELPEKTRAGEVLNTIKLSKNISNAELTGIYKSSYTFRVWYQHDNKTLSNSEVDKLRATLLKSLKSKHGATQN